MIYEVIFTESAKKDVIKLEKSGDKKSLKKLLSLLDELEKHPEMGAGKPEQLKYFDVPTWSRRISDKHRLVYQIKEKIVTILVLSAWGHYNDK
ncbi:Txe/YoeB family addiction module toxin [Pedobacter sp. SL55]|uniref:Txe/YoeB family addiction module toxin n=1 Tax=Pedobacter sp. SL55 TaxID=2995161 RepID=UPI0022702C5D|nr:Txe/YoeB family addiction module toxin [Pedobacter sp. SL55]WAC41115.1 Txe/YoeB family addiction module toxin [Pedobacter sp. SL55]